ncbi:MAG: 23S rRNA (pseudouridine(1915)-N(3))-methyltransferase RlmH [Alphaproteobacteria bacterium]|nr:23S rRNA (pseudouridine(1915)-N(3))-methyltransferase RlmH [Alphaproteobacteria bacterium]
MHITLSAIGKLKEAALKSLYEEYKKRLTWKLSLCEVEAKNSPSQEGRLLLNSIPLSSFLISLDEHGENLTSESFSELLNDIQINHKGTVAFVIGGADGLSEEVKVKAQKSISFGSMTWPHLMVRVMLMEQLYRAQQILKGHPYHRAQ